MAISTKSPASFLGIPFEMGDGAQHLPERSVCTLRLMVALRAFPLEKGVPVGRGIFFSKNANLCY
jgi:hypothetical protein